MSWQRARGGIESPAPARHLYQRLIEIALQKLGRLCAKVRGGQKGEYKVLCPPATTVIHFIESCSFVTVANWVQMKMRGKVKIRTPAETFGIGRGD